MDYRELVSRIPDGAVDLLFLDPPYNIGVFCKMPPDDYLAWCCEWIAEGDRILAPNGAFWVSHSDPRILAKLSDEIESRGRGLVNWITWDKYDWAYVRKFDSAGTRAFIDANEYLVYHADEGSWIAQCDREGGFIFESLRAYLAGERDRAEIDNSTINAAWCKSKRVQSTSQTQKWFSASCFNPPTQEAYLWLRELFGPGYFLREYEDLRREYEDLREQFENLRYTFNNPGKVSSVWQIPPAPCNGHETPKPEALLNRIIETTSNESDLVCDFFAGSFTTAVVAQRLGRRWICCDKEEKYVELGRQRLAQPLLL